MSVCKTIHRQPSLTALMHRLCSCRVGTSQLVSLRCCRSQAGQRAASRPSFSGLPPSEASLQQHGGGGCRRVWSYAQQWGLRHVSLAGRRQAFPLLAEVWGCRIPWRLPQKPQVGALGYQQES